MKSKNKIRPAIPRENPVRSAALPFDDPADAQQGGQNESGFA
jgi:hypothetical protein